MTKDYFKTDRQGRKYAGDHLLLDVRVEIYMAQVLSNPDRLEEILISAAKRSGATVVMSKFHSFGHGQGVSGVVMLKESHITIHTWPEKQYAAIDIFMCGDASTRIAAGRILHDLKCEDYDISVEKRGHENPNPWGYHMIIDMHGCDLDLIKHKPAIRSWGSSLIDTIEMKAYGEPMIEHFATHSHEAAGYTYMQMIETSNICAHFAENTGQVYVDIFSCKNFNQNYALEVTKQHFKPAISDIRMIKRG